MGCLWDIIVVAGIMVWVAGLYLQGYVPLWFLGAALVGLVVIRAFGRERGGNLSRLVRFLFIIALPVASIMTFAIIYGGGSTKDSFFILSQMLVLLAMLAGIYIMFRGLFSK